VTLEALFRRLVRAAVHEEVRVKGVPDASLSETSASSCVHDNWMTPAEAARDVQSKLRTYAARCRAAETLGLQCTDKCQASRTGWRSRPRSKRSSRARRFVR
jgi:hypothetical protein